MRKMVTALALPNQILMPDGDTSLSTMAPRLALQFSCGIGHDIVRSHSGEPNQDAVALLGAQFGPDIDGRFSSKPSSRPRLFA